MCESTLTALYWLSIPLGFGLALLALGCIAQFVSWVTLAWQELSELDKPYSVTPESMRDTQDH